MLYFAWIRHRNLSWAYMFFRLIQQSISVLAIASHLPMCTTVGLWAVRCSWDRNPKYFEKHWYKNNNASLAKSKTVVNIPHHSKSKKSISAPPPPPPPPPRLSHIRKLKKIRELHNLYIKSKRVLVDSERSGRSEIWDFEIFLYSRLYYYLKIL